MKFTKKQKLQRAKIRIKKRVQGSAERPRLAVFRSNKNIYAQIIDDSTNTVLVSASSVVKELDIKHGGNVESASLVGKLLATRAKEKQISKIVFDRGGRIYHGRIKALAEEARANGLEF